MVRVTGRDHCRGLEVGLGSLDGTTAEDWREGFGGVSISAMAVLACCSCAVLVRVGLGWLL